jgi:hypothetical protein
MECQDVHKGDCEGTVEMRMVNPSTWRHRELCEKHQREHLKVYEHAQELMSPTPAPWFDESYAGERWDDDY